MANKKLTAMLILGITLLSLLSTIAYAKPFTDAFRGGLMQINDFFVNEQYKPYSAAIDFFFFSLLFIAIYMMGARYAFKEVKKPEQVIVILLGLMTAFLLVLAGFSATIILPYIQWLLYTLLFILYFWLLKGIKNKFWRFILALLLTLLTIGLFQGLFGSLTAPDAEGFFRSFGGSFGAIQFPELPGPPGVPSYLQDLFGAPSVTTPTTPSETGVTETKTPTGTAKAEEGGISWSSVLIPLAVLIALGSGVLGYRKGWFRRGATGAQQPQAQERWSINSITDKIEEIRQAKNRAIYSLIDTMKTKIRVVNDATQKIAIINELGKKERANLWEGLKGITEQNNPLATFLNLERQFVSQLKVLQGIEKDFLNVLPQWQAYLQQNRIDINEEAVFFNTLISSENKDNGIIWLIAICYHTEKDRIDSLREELNSFLEKEDIDDLVLGGKFEKIVNDDKKLDEYTKEEKRVVVILAQQINEQINKLAELSRKISESARQLQAGQSPRTAQTIPIQSKFAHLREVMRRESLVLTSISSFAGRVKSRFRGRGARAIEELEGKSRQAAQELGRIEREGFARRSVSAIVQGSRRVGSAVANVIQLLPRTKAKNARDVARNLARLEQVRESETGYLSREPALAGEGVGRVTTIEGDYPTRAPLEEIPIIEGILDSDLDLIEGFLKNYTINPTKAANDVFEFVAKLEEESSEKKRKLSVGEITILRKLATVLKNSVYPNSNKIKEKELEKLPSDLNKLRFHSRNNPRINTVIDRLIAAINWEINKILMTNLGRGMLDTKDKPDSHIMSQIPEPPAELGKEGQSAQEDLNIRKRSGRFNFE